MPPSSRSTACRVLLHQWDSKPGIPGNFFAKKVETGPDDGGGGDVPNAKDRNAHESHLRKLWSVITNSGVANVFTPHSSLGHRASTQPGSKCTLGWGRSGAKICASSARMGIRENCCLTQCGPLGRLARIKMRSETREPTWAGGRNASEEEEPMRRSYDHPQSSQ